MGQRTSQVDLKPDARAAATGEPELQPHAMASFSREQLAFFIQHGYLIIKPTVPADEAFHDAIANGAAELLESGGLGNNLLPELPQLGKVLDAPELVAALQAILGEGYAMMPHRHCHVTEEGSKDQPFHRDSFFGFEQFRHVVPCEVMVNYYPQRVTKGMGPTALLPGSHFSRGQLNRGGMDFQPGSWADSLDQFLCTTSEPGICVIMHYHLWHRASGRISNEELSPSDSLPPQRWMFKFQFRRTKTVGSGSASMPLPSKESCLKNPFLKVCDRQPEVVSTAAELLPVPLSSVKETDAQTWTEFCAPVWAATWAAIRGEPLDILCTRAAENYSTQQSIMDSSDGAIDSSEKSSRESVRRKLVPDLSDFFVSGFTRDALVAHVDRLRSKDITARLSAVHALAFGCACSAWPSEQVVEALLPILKSEEEECNEEEVHEEDTSDAETGEEVAEQPAIKKGRWGEGEARATAAWLGRDRPDQGIPRMLRERCLAAAALQLLRTPLPEGSDLGAEFSAILGRVAENEEEYERLPGQSAHWSLEALLAVPAVLSPHEAVQCLTSFLKVPVPRAQLHASIALYALAMRCDAAFSDQDDARAVRDAISKFGTEEALLSVVEFWAEEFAPEARRRLAERLKRRRTPIPVQDGGGRYALAEALRCLGYCASKEVAKKAAVMAGADPDVLCAQEDKVWRKRFVRFVERYWECPITSPFSPF